MSTKKPSSLGDSDEESILTKDAHAGGCQDDSVSWDVPKDCDDSDVSSLSLSGRMKQIYFSSWNKESMEPDPVYIPPCQPEDVVETPECPPKAAPHTTSAFFNLDAPEEPTPTVLEPDHPMMARFQETLKKHLQRQLDRYMEQIFEMDTELKNNDKEREAAGVGLYAAQQEVFRQQKTLDDYQEKLEAAMKEREELEATLKCRRCNWKEMVDMINAEKKKENDLLLEQTKASALARQLAEWESEMDSDLAVNQRISEKTMIEKKQKIEAKRQLDILMLRLMTEVTKFEQELSVLKAEIDVKLEEKEVVHQSVADATADLQALAAEQKRLFAAWNSVVVVMGQRDGIYNSVCKDLRDCQEAFQSLTSEIESYKRSTLEEMRKNEQLAIIYGRVQNDLENAAHALKMAVEKKAVLEGKMATVAAMMAETERDLNMVKVETTTKEAQLAAIMAEMGKFISKKRVIEDEILALLQDQMIDDKAAASLNKLVKDTREKTRKAEMGMVDMENRIAKQFFDNEEFKGVILRNSDILAEMNKELQEKEFDLKDKEMNLKKMILQIQHRQGDMNVVLKKVERAREKTGQTGPVKSPMELKILELTKLNEELQEKNDELQTFWLVQQSGNVRLTRQRDDQLKEIHILRKQVVIMTQRTLKIEMEMDKENQMALDLGRAIGSLQNKVATLGASLNGRKDYQEQLDKENAFAQTLFMQDLKESETEQVRLKAEILDLEGQLEELAEAMLDTQREMLAWEKKIKLAIETKHNLQQEKMPSGQVGQMKLEIHRMEVRYGQLRRAQDKLIADLESCVMRREAMVDEADAKEKRVARGYNNKFSIQKKLEDMRSKIRQLQAEQRSVEGIIAATESGHQELLNQMNEKTEQLKKLEETSKEMDLQLEDGCLHKQQNLEMLVRRQKKYRMYTQVKAGKHKLLFRNEMALETEMGNVRGTNDKLVGVMEALIQDFPGQRYHLLKIYNLAKAKPS